ncbi:MAG: DUF2064 domain-containing protein [Acidimicrobiales bacterium]|jgi:hypothetical protein|nr:DUF2064 domain-containing protein [Acidimicrobiales bacterium]
MQVAVITKSPVPGRVKTRLCPPCTPEQAAALYRASLCDVLAAVATCRTASRRVVLLDGEPGPWLPTGFDVVAQRGTGLADRLANGMTDLFGSGAGPVLIVSGETPTLHPGELDGAAALLGAGRHDALLGPSPDGGYWAVGLSRPDAAAFDGVPMSSPVTRARQWARLVARGYSVGALGELRDLDHFGDAVALAAADPGTRFARAFAELGLAPSDR